MSAPLDLARPELRHLRPYQPASYAPDAIRLNANEAPWRSPGDATARGLNLYPPAYPAALGERLATHYGVDPERLLVTRGSSEAIDLLIRAFCRPGRDRILICPPTFGMYEVYAEVQAAGVDRVPLDAARDFALDPEAVTEALTDETRLVFLCSPNNPTGNLLDPAAVETVLERAAGRALVVVDEAYVEFAGRPSLVRLQDRHPHLAVLRTLSKALALAGARCGALVADPSVVALLAGIMPPYAFSTPSLEAALAVLAPDTLATMSARIELLARERERVASRLEALAPVERVWPSDANFLLIRVDDPARFAATAAAAGFLLRDFSGQPGLSNCLRISVGTPEQNDGLLGALEAEYRAP